MSCNSIFCPAYFLENMAFGSGSRECENNFIKEVVPRVIAVVAPVFYALQSVVYFTASLLDLVLCLCCISPGILFQYAAVHTIYSMQNLVSSFLEIPEKLIHGSYRPPNYCGDHQRYQRIDLTEQILLM